MLRHYIEHNVSKSTATTIKYFMKMLANIAETVIFMFLGLSTIVDTLNWNWGFIMFALLFCIIYRVVGKFLSLTLFLLNTTCPVLANSVDPDQLASEEAN